MRIDRLTAIADMLDALPLAMQSGAAGFDMGYWRRKTECGTSACAIGHAVMAGILPEVELIQARLDATFCYPVPAGSTDVNLAPGPFLTIAGALGITVDGALHLFNDGDYAPPDDNDEEVETTPAMVAARIREFIADHGRTER